MVIYTVFNKLQRACMFKVDSAFRQRKPTAGGYDPRRCAARIRDLGTNIFVL